LEDLVGRVALVGVTGVDEHDEVVGKFQLHGVVQRADEDGIVLARAGGGEFSLPPAPDWFEPAGPGEYRLRATGEVVVDPDYLVTVTVQVAPGGSLADLEQSGFEAPE
jgi:hypothetical protein